MKTLKCLSVLLFLASCSLGQEFRENLNQRYIEVTGSAEEEVLPDEIYLRIGLREFERDKAKVTLAELEPKLIRVIQGLKIDPKDLVIENLHGHEYILRKRRKEFFASKSYILRLRNVNMMDTLVGRLDEIDVKEIGISRVEYSKMDELRQKVKTDAVKAARSKAVYLMQALGENIGKTLLVREINNDYIAYDRPMYSNLSEKMSMGGAAEPLPELSFRNIKVRYEMLTRFEIK